MGKSWGLPRVSVPGKSRRSVSASDSADVHPASLHTPWGAEGQKSQKWGLRWAGAVPWSIQDWGRPGAAYP